jgi:CDP-glycerol glycerophosphotransferase (TagB/SpsB family)
LFKLIGTKEKVTFVVSFGDNSTFVYNELKNYLDNKQIIFLKKKGSKIDHYKISGATLIPFETFNVVAMFKSIYHLATSKYILVDNYFAFLSCVKFNDSVQCIQLWHAVGAIKKFGLKDRSIEFRTRIARRRFKNVYRKFNKIVVGSDAMANIFIEAFGLSNENILRTGIPRTDLFYDRELKKSAINNVKSSIKLDENKKVILYAPTYREKELSNYNIRLDLDLLYRELKNNYILLVKLHPVLKCQMNKIDSLYSDFIINVTDYPNINELLLVTDYLITDYSSIPFEFALLNKPMIFFPYDLEDYKNDRGLWGEYERLVPGPILFSSKDIVRCIKENNFDLSKIRDFSYRWNAYSQGNSSRNLVNFLFQDKSSYEFIREVL